MLAPYAEPYVAAPLFLLQSKFDHFQLNAEAGLRCMNPAVGGQPYAPPWSIGPNATCGPPDQAAIAAYGADFWRFFAAAASRSRKARGVFLTSCIIHGQTGSAAWNHTEVDGATPATAFAAWYADRPASAARDGKWVENCSMPCNPNARACAPWRPTRSVHSLT